MQKTSTRQAKSSAGPLAPHAEEIIHFPLPGLLKASHTLALNTLLGTLSLLSYSSEGPRLVGLAAVYRQRAMRP
jgi:hypothetical protein